MPSLVVLASLEVADVGETVDSAEADELGVTSMVDPPAGAGVLLLLLVLLLAAELAAEPVKHDASLLAPTVYCWVRKMYRLSLRIAVNELPDGRSTGTLTDVSRVPQVGAGAVPFETSNLML